MIRVALMGAGGKMGCRITDNMKDLPEYDMSYVEVSEAGIERLRKLGVEVTPQDEALKDADTVILAVPDILIGKISEDIVPKLKPRTMIIGLDPAAAYAEVMPIRDDLTYFVTHPCHPPLFHDEPSMEARTDWFGGTAHQDIVNAIYKGPDSDYEKGDAIAKHMYKPVRKSYKITVEQMAVLEPALVETFTLTLVDSMKQGFEEAVKLGVPRDAAWSFLLGHVRIELAIVLGFAGFPVSDGAKLAMEQARKKIFKQEWKEQIFSVDKVKESVREITGTLKK